MRALWDDARWLVLRATLAAGHNWFEWDWSRLASRRRRRLALRWPVPEQCVEQEGTADRQLSGASARGAQICKGAAVIFRLPEAISVEARSRCDSRIARAALELSPAQRSPFQYTAAVPDLRTQGSAGKVGTGL